MNRLIYNIKLWARWNMGIVLLLIIVTLIGAIAIVARAQSSAEVAPYEVGDIKTPLIGHVAVYKVAHQGCELFVVIGNGIHEYTTAITTGRGCK